MSDTLNPENFRYSKRRINQIDDTIENLTHEVDQLKDLMFKTELEWSLMTVKLKREKIKALSAFARSQELLADMDVLIAESDLFAAVEKMKNFKKIKLDREALEEKSQKELSKETTSRASTSNSASVKSTKKTDEKKKSRKHSSRSKSPVDISADETVLIQTINESAPSLPETSQTTSFSQLSRLLNKPPENQSDSEGSLSSSVRVELGLPYTKTQARNPEKKTPIQTQISDKWGDSKSKSKHVSKSQPTQSPKTTSKTQTVADLRRSVNTASNQSDKSLLVVSTSNSSRSSSGDRTAASTSTYVPARHNMPAIIMKPSTSNPRIYVNPATQTNIHYHSQRSGSSQSFNFYGNKQ